MSKRADAQVLRSRRQTEHAGRRGSFFGEADGSDQAGSSLERLKGHLVGESRSAVQGSEPVLFGANWMVVWCPQLHSPFAETADTPPKCPDPSSTRSRPNIGAAAARRMGWLPALLPVHPRLCGEH
jgi:hypothetical protein